MPRRSPPPDRLACEAALSSEELVVLRGQAAAMGVPPDRWDKVPSLASIWGTHATVRLAAKLREQSELTEDRALAIAAGKLGLSGETVRTRLRRFFGHAYGL